MTNLILEPFITEEQIQSKVKEIGSALTKRFRNESVVAICVLRGSFLFYSDLIRALDMDVTCDFFGVSSYHGTTSSGEVKLTLDLTNSLENKNVLLVEDIVDSGITMNYLMTCLSARKPKTLTTVALLEKPEAIKVPCQLDYVGFQITNEFVVGYGLDYLGYYRNLPYIAQVQNFQ